MKNAPNVKIILPGLIAFGRGQYSPVLYVRHFIALSTKATLG
jgi:hypothetical protein